MSARQIPPGSRRFPGVWALRRFFCPFSV